MPDPLLQFLSGNPNRPRHPRLMGTGRTEDYFPPAPDLSYLESFARPDPRPAAPEERYDPQWDIPSMVGRGYDRSRAMQMKDIMGAITAREQQEADQRDSAWAHHFLRRSDPQDPKWSEGFTRLVQQYPGALKDPSFLREVETIRRYAPPPKLPKDAQKLLFDVESFNSMDDDAEEKWSGLQSRIQQHLDSGGLLPENALKMIGKMNEHRDVIATRKQALAQREGQLGGVARRFNLNPNDFKDERGRFDEEKLNDAISREMARVQKHKDFREALGKLEKPDQSEFLRLLGGNKITPTDEQKKSAFMSVHGREPNGKEWQEAYYLAEPAIRQEKLETYLAQMQAYNPDLDLEGILARPAESSPQSSSGPQPETIKIPQAQAKDAVSLPSRAQREASSKSAEEAEFSANDARRREENSRMADSLLSQLTERYSGEAKSPGPGKGDQGLADDLEDIVNARTPEFRNGLIDSFMKSNELSDADRPVVEELVSRRERALKKSPASPAVDVSHIKSIKLVPSGH